MVADECLLTRRESTVLVLLAKGHSNKYISESLFVADGTVNTHVARIYRKLGVHSREDVIALIDEKQLQLRPK
jgi:DNA-binding NarL/FixJ family response regulator